MKILVTGGAGFIGSHLTRKLLSQGCEVVALDNLSTGLRENMPAGVELIEMDVCDPQLVDVFAKQRFDMVVHLAGQTMVDASIRDPQVDQEVNIGGTVNVLEAARKSKVRRIVFASTAAAYGDADQLPIKESTAVNPQSFYGLSKVTVEHYLDLYQRFFGLEYVVLRFSNVYGERQGDGGEGGVISIFTKRIAAEQPIQFMVMENRHVTLFMPAMSLLVYGGHCRRRASNMVCNLSTQTEVSLNELVGILTNVAGRKIQPVYGVDRAGDIKHSMLSNARARKYFDWKPMTSLEDGLQRTYLYFKMDK